jgi:hypothetical protein
VRPSLTWITNIDRRPRGVCRTLMINPASFDDTPDVGLSGR